MAVRISSRTPVKSKDEEFFKALGVLIAQTRKAQNITQQQLADQLGIAQQTLAHYEVGRVRFPASTLAILVQVLGLTPDEMLGQERAKGRPGPTPRLQQQIERISQLPRTKQHFVMEMLDTVIAQAGH